VTKSSVIFVNKLKQEQRFIALSLARVCHHVHPDIVELVRLANEQDREQLAEIIPNGIDIEDYLYTGSVCVFPGVRRYIGRLKKEELLRYVPEKGAIIDDNRFPRYLWTYLVLGKGYSGPIWKATGLNEFELAHIFSHKLDERKPEDLVFEQVAPSPKPYGLFTSVSNMVLIPKGMAKPTDGLDAILIASFKRFIDLYGIDTLPGLRGLKEKKIPEWYDDLEWNEQTLPPNWKDRVRKLPKYRKERLKSIFSAPDSSDKRE
jgi:hypothetical protein